MVCLVFALGVTSACRSPLGLTQRLAMAHVGPQRAPWWLSVSLDCKVSSVGRSTNTDLRLLPHKLLKVKTYRITLLVTAASWSVFPNTASVNLVVAENRLVSKSPKSARLLAPRCSDSAVLRVVLLDTDLLPSPFEHGDGRPALSFFLISAMCVTEG